MPKKKQRKTQQSSSKAVAASTDDVVEKPDVDSDNESGISQLSLDDSVSGESVLGVGEISNEEDRTEIMHDKVREIIDNAGEKNIRVRTHALKRLSAALGGYYEPDFVNKWKITMVDCLEKNLRKSNDKIEASLSVRCAAQLAVQLHSDSSDVLQKILAQLRVSINDSGLALQFRCDGCLSLSLCTYLAEQELESITKTADALEDLWSHFKAGCEASLVPLFCASISGWALVVLRLPVSAAKLRIAKFFFNGLFSKGLLKSPFRTFPKLLLYLSSPHIEMRIECGETLAVIYELGDQIYSEQGFKPAHHQNVLDLIGDLINDSVKYRAKRERRTQRSTFREILASIKGDNGLEIPVKFGSETLYIDSFEWKLFYDGLCDLLGGNISYQLKENLSIRNSFELGMPVGKKSDAQKMSKLQRLSINQEISKRRSLVRGKQRDKRSAALSGE